MFESLMNSFTILDIYAYFVHYLYYYFIFENFVILLYFDNSATSLLSIIWLNLEKFNFNKLKNIVKLNNYKIVIKK